MLLLLVIAEVYLYRSWAQCQFKHYKKIDFFDNILYWRNYHHGIDDIERKTTFSIYSSPSSPVYGISEINQPSTAKSSLQVFESHFYKMNSKAII